MRLDLLTVARGLAPSRQKAQELIRNGFVTVNGRQYTRPSGDFSEADILGVTGETCPFVSRGGLKLACALDRFGICVQDKVCADIGASTGGFSDCLLSRGARKIYAVDSGQGQLAEKLRKEPRIVSMEKVNARHLTPERLGEPVDLLCCDVSFISVTLLFPVFASLLSEKGEAVILIKPQFEVGKAGVGKNGVVRSPELRRRAVESVIASASGSELFTAGLTASPILGGDGNREFLIRLRKEGPAISREIISDFFRNEDNPNESFSL